MDPVIEKIINTGLAERTALSQGDFALAMARARDTALHGLKVVEGVVAKELLVSDDAAEFGRTNAAIRVPTTVDHPNAVVAK